MKVLTAVFLAIITISCTSTSDKTPYNPEADTLKYGQEVHLQNVRLLTFGGDNAQTYRSYDNTKLIFQSNNPEWRFF